MAQERVAICVPAFKKGQLGAGPWVLVGRVADGCGSAATRAAALEEPES